MWVESFGWGTFPDHMPRSAWTTQDSLTAKHMGVSLVLVVLDKLEIPRCL